MAISQIIEELKQERDRIDKVLNALLPITDGSGTPRRGKQWTAAQRRKFKATMAAKKNGK